VWVAVEGAAIGWVEVDRDRVAALYVSPSCAGRGVGSGLLAHAESSILRSGYTAARLESSQNALDFYLRRGYLRSGPPDADGAYPLRKDLAAVEPNQGLETRQEGKDAMQLSKLKGALIHAQILPDIQAAIQALTPELGLTYDEHSVFGRHTYRYARLAFAAPVATTPFCEAMGWQRPYALSTDVHQTRWTIQLWVADLDDPYGPRIYTRYPSLDDWAVIAQLSGRPEGALPALHAGASPAYDLRAYTADIVSLEVHAWADLQR
jgi:hypothetical protein